MTYLLDTNICIAYLNGRSLKVAHRIISTSREDIAVCSVVKAELFFGAIRSKKSEQTTAEQFVPI